MPKALFALDVPGLTVEWPLVEASAPIKKGTPDERWIPWVGQHGFLVFSCNTQIWQAEAQRTLLISHALPSGVLVLRSGKKTGRVAPGVE